MNRVQDEIFNINHKSFDNVYKIGESIDNKYFHLD